MTEHEYTKIKVAIKRGQLEMAKELYRECEKLLEDSKTNLCECLGEYDQAIRKARERPGKANGKTKTVQYL